MSSCGIVLAAGSGARFGGRKQCAEVAGRRLVDHAVELLTTCCDRVVVVLPPDEAWTGRPVHAVVAGGDTRFASVRSGLAAAGGARVVVIHDAAHPLASTALAAAVISAVDGGADAAVPGIRPHEAVKEVAGSRVVATIGRDRLVLTQMPQAFDGDQLRRAHAVPPPGGAVEDSELVEAMGGTVVVVPGERRNVHVTDPTSLAIAETLSGLES